MTVKIEEFVAHLGWDVDPGKLKEFDKQVGEITQTFKKVALAIGAATAAVTALVIHTNRETAEMANLAKSVGITTENLLALSGVVSEIGLNTENVIDLVEEMNNKMGEKKGLGEFTAVEESLKILNLDFKELRDLKPDEQFTRIFDAASKLADQQKAVSAVDMLFGGEANKILGFLRATGLSLEEILERRKQLNFLSEEGVEGAIAFNHTLSETETIISSIWAQFSGLVGEILTPMIKEFSNWVIENKELIKVKVAEWAENVAFFLEKMWKFFKFLVGVVNKVTDLFGGFGNTLAFVGGILAGFQLVKIIKVFQLLATVIGPAIKQIGLFKAAMTFGKMAGAIGLIVLAALAINSLVRFLQGKDSLVGDIGESIAESMDQATGAVAEFFGFSKEEFQYFLVQYIDLHKEFLNKTVEFISAYADEWRNIEWNDIFDFWKEDFSQTIQWIEDLFISLINFISGIPNKIAEVFNGLPGIVQNILKRIPGIDLISQGIGFLTGNAPTQSNTQTGSPGLSTSIAQTRNLQNTVNRQSTQTTNQYNNQFDIQQLPGEDSERFAHRVTAILEENAATAVRNNASGVKV